MLTKSNVSFLQLSLTFVRQSMLIKPLLLIFMMLSTGCASATDNNMEFSREKARQEALSKIDILACLDKGGVIKSACMLGLPFCIENYIDAGKACTDSTECAGECRIENEFVEPGSETSGLCSTDNDPCGCFQTIASGVAKQVICVD